MSGSHGPSRQRLGCPCLRCRGFPPGNTLSLRHRARSERRVRPPAAGHRRRLGLRAGDLDPLGRAYLDLYSANLAL